MEYSKWFTTFATSSDATSSRFLRVCEGMSEIQHDMSEIQSSPRMTNSMSEFREWSYRLVNPLWALNADLHRSREKSSYTLAWVSMKNGYILFLLLQIAAAQLRKYVGYVVSVSWLDIS